MESITLYKFHKYNVHLLQLLARNEFHCSTRQQLNDPYDLTNIILQKDFVTLLLTKDKSPIGDPEKLWNAFFSKNFHPGYYEDESPELEKRVRYILQNDENMRDFIEILLDEIGYKVISFCGEPDTPEFRKQRLMWGYYAGIDGVRLKFKLPIGPQFVNFEEVKLEAVNYEGGTPYVNSEHDLRNALTLKDKEWHDENEYRIITKINNSLKFKKEYLNEIVFGAQMDADIMVGIIRMMHRMGFLNCEYKRLITTVAGLDYREITKYEVEQLCEENVGLGNNSI